ncbi:Protein RecA [Chlorella vulgaris]
MLRTARSRLQGRAAAFSSVLVQAAAGSMGVTKMAAAAKERAAARAAIDPADDAKATWSWAARALDSVLKEINSRFGKNSIMKMGSANFGEVVTTPTGALTLDLALGGGYPKGRVVEIYGPESSGKTTLALHAMAEVQKQGGTVALIDAEHAFDALFAKRLGLNVDDMVLCQPDCGEMALETVDSLIRSSAVDLIAIDSVAALVPRAELEGEIGQVQVGAQARLMSGALRKVAGNASKHNCTIIFLNQLRQKVGVIYGSPEVTSGGMALKYYASVRLEVRIKEKISAGAEGQVGIRVKANVKKNKVAPPYKLAEFDILFGSGISAVGCMLDAAEAVAVVQRRGSWYYFGEQRLAQGRDKTLDVIKEDGELRGKIESQTRQVLSGKDINDLYEDEQAPAVEESFAEGDGVLREAVDDEK